MISVIIQAHSEEKYIADCVQSMLEQIYTDI